MNETERNLLDAAIANPFDDLPRLVMADFYDENGSPGRAEFIRVQTELANYHHKEPTGDTKAEIDSKWEDYEESKAGLSCRSFHLLVSSVREWFGSYVPYIDSVHGTHRLNTLHGTEPEVQLDIHRGFPSSISCTLAVFMESICEGCYGDDGDASGAGHGNYRCSECPSCNGSGRAPGLVERIGRIWPITSVTLTDREPYDTGLLGWRWITRITDDTDSPNCIGKELYRKLPGCVGNGKTQPHWPTRAAAMTALSHAATDYLRSRANLPPLYTAAGNRAASAARSESIMPAA